MKGFGPMRRPEQGIARFGVPARAIVVLLASLALVAHARAETIRIGRVPSNPAAAGLTVVAEMEVVSGNGYQPITLTFSPNGKSFRRDRHLQIEITPHNSGRTELDFTYRHSIVVPEGAAPLAIPVYVPHYYPWEAIRLRLSEDGRPIETGDRKFQLGSGLRTRFAEQTVTVGIISPMASTLQGAAWKTFPDVRTLVTVLGEGPIPEGSIKRLGHQASMKLAQQVQPAWVQFRPIDEANLHDDWLGYSQLDVIIVAAPVLERIERRQPIQFDHLIDWLAAGGNLWVYAASNLSKESFVGSAEIDPVSPSNVLPPQKVAGQLDLKSDNDNSELIYDNWSGVHKESQVYSYRSTTNLSKRGDVYQRLRQEQHPFAATVPASEIASEVAIGSFGLGKITTIKDDDPFPGSFQFWKSIVGLHPKTQLTWTERMGVDVPRGNDNYWMWLIASVGQPPVKSFVLLNTLFVILVGPVCYFFLRRRQRLYLLYFFAPSMALLVTISLFAYALGADGTKTKLRSRQLTWIDIDGDYAVAQSRQTYYAVLGSGGGIRFPSDAAVYPVRNAAAYNRYQQRYNRSRDGGRQGEIRIAPMTQHFGGNFLPPRNQVQYLITHPQRVDESLEFTLAAEENSVTSHLPYQLRRLLVRDADGAYWQAEDVLADRTTPLKPSSVKVLGELLGTDVLPPLGSVPMLKNNRGRWGGPGTGIQVSLLENRLESWSRRLPPKSFVAIADLIEDRLGVEDAVVVDSVHVVMGEIP